MPVSRADGITVPAGYRASVFVPWGTPINGAFSRFPRGRQQQRGTRPRSGRHGPRRRHFFPIDGRHGGGRRSNHGLLVFNNEYIDAPLLHPNGPTTLNGLRTSAEKCRKSTPTA